MPTQRQVPSRRLEIDTNHLEPLECSATMMAAMAYPARDEEANRHEAFGALVARTLHEQIRLTRDERPFQNPRLNRYLELKSEGEASQISRRVSKILARRSEVGEVAAPWIFYLVGKEPNVGALTEAALEDRVATRLSDRDPENWVRRTWRPAKPVFHLIAAYQLVAYLSPTGAKDPFNPDSAPFRAPDGELTPIVAKAAMALQEKLVSDERFAFAKGDLLWLDWK